MQDCELCKLGDDQYCQKCVFTYNGKDWADDDKLTYGGYSNRVVVNHQCALSVPAPAPLQACTVIIFSQNRNRVATIFSQALACMGINISSTTTCGHSSV